MRVLTVLAAANAVFLAILVGLAVHGVYHRRCTEAAAGAAQAWQAVALGDLDELVKEMGDSSKSVPQAELVDIFDRHIQNDTEIVSALASGHAARAAKISTTIDWTAGRAELVREMDVLYPKGRDVRVYAQHLADRAADTCK